MRQARAVIIGSRNDVHVERVLALCAGDIATIDAESLSSGSVTLSPGGLEVESESGNWRFSTNDGPIRGWVRRLAPEDWQRGVVGGSRESAERSAWLSMIAAIGRSADFEWLTGLDEGLIAENKPHQLAIAQSVGIAVPRTVVTNRAESVRSALPNHRIVKALGRGHYIDGDDARVMFAQEVDDARLADITGDIPLIFQQRIMAHAHLRVVVVRDRVWTCSLAAQGLPLDWRAEAIAHDSFEDVPTPPAIQAGAPLINRALRLGYSSQDWIVADGGPYLIDVNPGGQWLFLPETTATEIATEIANWLEKR